MKIDLNKIQLDFLRRACEFNWEIIEFSLTDNNFEKDYGYTKDEAHIAILNLKRRLRELL
jgi:hypothetical protein